MKRKTLHVKEQIKNKPTTKFKKQKASQLSESQKIIADEDIISFLDKGKKDILKLELSLMFDTPKKIEALLVYTHYKMFWWAIEHQDFELMQYVIDKTTERGKFLIVCHNDYEIIKKFIDLNIEKIKDCTYQSSSALKTLSILLDANPNKSHLIKEAVKQVINKNALADSETANVLKADFQDAIIEFSKIEKENYAISDKSQFISTSDYNHIDQELSGKIPDDEEEF